MKEIDKLTKDSTKSRMRVLEEKYKDPTKVIETLHKAGFFDVYGPSWL